MKAERCANTEYLNQYLRTLDREQAYEDEVDRRLTAALDAPITEDDVYELADSLTLRDAKVSRELLAERYRAAKADKDAVLALGMAMLEAMEANRSARFKTDIEDQLLSEGE